jgi:hypothetical protein
MQQDAKVFRRIFTALGAILLLIAAAIVYSQFRDARDAVHTDGLIVDTVWRNNHNSVGNSGAWFPVVAFRPTQYTLVFESSIGSVFYEHSEGDAVGVAFRRVSHIRRRLTACGLTPLPGAVCHRRGCFHRRRAVLK